MNNNKIDYDSLLKDIIEGKIKYNEELQGENELDKLKNEIDKRESKKKTKKESMDFINNIVDKAISEISQFITSNYSVEVMQRFKNTLQYDYVIKQFKKLQKMCSESIENEQDQQDKLEEIKNMYTQQLKDVYDKHKSMFDNFSKENKIISFVETCDKITKKQIKEQIEESVQDKDKQQKIYEDIIKDFDVLKEECLKNIKKGNHDTITYDKKCQNKINEVIKSLNQYKNSNINEEDSKSEYESCYSKLPKPDKTEEYEKSNHSINKIGIFGKENNNKEEEEDIKYEDENCIEEIKNNMKYNNFMKNKELKKEEDKKLKEDNKSNHNKINEIDKRLESSNSEIQPQRDSRGYTDLCKLLKEYEKSNNSESIIINNSYSFEESNNKEEGIKDEDDSFSKDIKLIKIKENIIRQDNNPKRSNLQEEIINNALDEIYNPRNISFTDKVKNFCFEKWNSFKGLFKISCKDCNICLKNENQSQINFGG